MEQPSKGAHAEVNRSPISSFPATSSWSPAAPLERNISFAQDLMYLCPKNHCQTYSPPHLVASWNCFRRRMYIVPQSSFEAFVLDEADRLLRFGVQGRWSEGLRTTGYSPDRDIKGSFSASISEAVGQTVGVGLRNPVRVKIKNF